ncbi:hypothetical protein [Lysobacter capsici]|uniref:hypothetical protein n=1 Tax=Lysobacter capsici TaxID=435897 RepID=UPI00128C2AAB|nr:hypothetical protein [Lysobacter capsici]
MSLAIAGTSDAAGDPRNTIATPAHPFDQQIAGAQGREVRATPPPSGRLHRSWIGMRQRAPEKIAPAIRPCERRRTALIARRFFRQPGASARRSGTDHKTAVRTRSTRGIFDTNQIFTNKKTNPKLAVP